MEYAFDADLASLLPFPLRAVPRIADVDRDVFERVVRRADTPMVIEGAIDDWAALTSWKTPDRLGDLIGRDTTIHCRELTSEPEKWVEDFVPHRFGDFIDEVYCTDDSSLYLTQGLLYEPIGFMRRMIRAVFPALLQEAFVDCALPEFIEPHEVGEGIIWMGGAHQVTPTHFDPTANINCTVLGEKRWIFFPPDHGRSLLVDGRDGQHCWLSSIEDLTTGGTWRGGPIERAYEVITRPGDTLFAPAGWHHQVITSNETSVGINFWYVDPTSLRTFTDYGRFYAIDWFGYTPRVRRNLFAAAVVAGMAAAYGAYRAAPRLFPHPEISVGKTTYGHATLIETPKHVPGSKPRSA